MSLGEKLKKGRLDKKLSQADVADQLNISRQSISKWENGYNYPDIDNLILLSKLYEMSTDELLHEKERESQLNKRLEQSIEEKSLPKEIVVKEVVKIKNDEGLLLLILSLMAMLLTPIGIFIAAFILRKNKRENTHYKLINLACVFSILVNLFFTYQFISDYYKWNIKNDVQYIEG
ncbi:helix-turn-helix domain-containing protein [Bacillus massiliigorillae]|uniref:helix-turn-helix domain-containing protein n=1 Tax=Bacillus massiliigorillae TaxID=1243664 RepID=UPI0003A0875B|nr:helix-turn-helix transcriptional regulator [Bacillus massiliigorillae]